MNKKSIALLLAVASSCASSAFAASFFDKIVSKHSSAKPSITKSHKITKQANRSYANFSGTWDMDCGDSFNGTVVIENDDSYIDFNGESYRIGQGLQGNYKSNEGYTDYDHTSLEWNADGNVLIAKNVFVSKENIDRSDILTVVSSSTLAMVNGQLVLDGSYTQINGGAQNQKPMTMHCVFTKKQQQQ